MKISLFFLTLFFAMSELQAQTSEPTPECIKLKPITTLRLRYFYGSEKVRDGYSLQIPLLALNDNEINKQFKKYNRLRWGGGYFYFVPLAYLFYVVSSNNGGVNQDQRNVLNLMILGAAAANIGCYIGAEIELRKGIDRYNILISPHHRIGMNLDFMPGNQRLLNVGIARTF